MKRLPIILLATVMLASPFPATANSSLIREEYTMLKTMLTEQIRRIITDWPVADQYAISFFVYTNDCYVYGPYTNVAYFSISYNTESFLDSDDPEERWNFAFWPHTVTPIIDPDDPTPATHALFRWYAELGLKNIGVEDTAHAYDHGRYIGTGPEGLPQLLAMITDIARELQESGFIEDKFGRQMPILIHDLEYTWYTVEATKQANVHGEADQFLADMCAIGFIE